MRNVPCWTFPKSVILNVMKEKGFTPILLLVGVLILMAVGGGAYYLGTVKNKLSIQNPVVISQVNPTSFTQPVQPPPNSHS